MSNTVLGHDGELAAAEYLESEGLQIITRNWRCPLGEIDIVAQDGDCLVVCEVKTRRSSVCGSAVEAVTPAKLARLRRLAASWLRTQERYWPDVRIDVIAIRWSGDHAEDIDHLRGVG